MSRKLKGIVFSFFILTIAILSAGCAINQEVRTEDAPEAEVAGTYSVILYRSSVGWANLETLAILSKEDAPYTIVPFASQSEYRIIKGLPAKEALARADAFIGANTYVDHTELSRITDSSSGALLGYEIRPLYRRIDWGNDDVLTVRYWKADDKVFVKMHLIYEVDKRVNGGQD